MDEDRVNTGGDTCTGTAVSQSTCSRRHCQSKGPSGICAAGAADYGATCCGDLFIVDKDDTSSIMAENDAGEPNLPRFYPCTLYPLRLCTHMTCQHCMAFLVC